MIRRRTAPSTATGTTAISLPALLLSLALALPAGAASVPAPSGGGGAVASGDAYASEAGLEILQAGGNAVDAAVASALALAVTFPEAGNLGGGGFAVVRIPDADRGEPQLASLDFRERAPAAAHRDMYLDESGQPVRESSLVGPLAAGVPGSPAGLWTLHERYGELPWSRVVEPAIRLARDGFTVGPQLHRVLGAKRDVLARFPETAAVWLPGGEPPAVGSRMVLPELAATLAAFAERGLDAVTRGPVAERIEAVSAAHGGILTAADLAAYEPVWREPVRFSAFGWNFAGMNLPSSGGILTGQVLGLLERTGWADRPRFGADRAHLLVESMRLAYADRFLLGDPATTEPTVADLLADEWLDLRAASISPDRAADSDAVGDWSQRQHLAAGDDAAAATSGETTHLSVADGRGGFVSLTTTVNDLFGCGLWVPGFGFLNDEMDDFAAAPGRPNLYGLVQGEANAVAPGKRMLSSMSPTIAWSGDGEVGGEVILLGGRGGSRIPSATIQVLLALIVDGDPLQTALDRPRLHHQWLPDTLYAEADALAPETRAVLDERGHAIEVTRAAAKVHAVRRRADGSFEAASDPRGPGAAAVVEPAIPVCCFLPRHPVPAPAPERDAERAVID